MLSNTSDLDLRLIRIFMAVADAQGVTAAEPLLGMRQSAISTQLSILESRIGFRLCERGRGGFRLTSKGERFVILARTLTAATADFATQVQELDRRLIGTLSLGLVGQLPQLEEVRIADAIALFRKRDQAVRIVIESATARKLEKGLLDNQFDVAIGYFWRHSARLAYTQLFSEQQSVYCGRNHPLFPATSQPSTHELQNHEWVSRTYPLSQRPEALAQCRISANADNVEAALILILSGSHLGYLPSHYAAPLQQQNLLRPLAPEHFNLDLTLHLAIKRDAINRSIIKAFLNDVLDVYRLERPPHALASRKHLA